MIDLLFKSLTMIKYLNLLFFAGMILVNYLANALPLNNKTTGEISGLYPNLFVPAGITFSIWGIIYLLLAGYVVVQFTARSETIPAIVGWLFAISCIFNGLWIFAWHFEKLPLSLFIMTGLLLSLIFINIQIRELSFGLTKAAFGIYLGWICIATIANVTALLVRYNWNGFGIPEEVWTIAMITAGTLIVVLTLLKLNNPFIGLVVVWAFAGIIINRHADYRIIALAALVGLLIVAVFSGLVFFKR